MKLLLSYNVKNCSNHPSSYSALLSILKIIQPYIYIYTVTFIAMVDRIKFYPETTGNV